MNDYTKALHQRFYQESENTEEEREMDRAEQALKATLNREQRRLLLALVNAQSLWQERTSLESFAAGLRLGLGIAGVDMLESAEGPQIMEVNSSPGLEGIEKATGIDVASAIIEFVEQQVLFPDVDLRQRLRLTGGFGIAEFPVRGMPELEGKTLRDTPLASRNIYVLTITRHDAVVPQPKADDIIQTGDVLLCYGDLRELRSMMPPHKRRKRPRKRNDKEKNKG